LENGGVVVCSRGDPIRPNGVGGVSQARRVKGTHGVGAYIGTSVGDNK